MANRTVMLARLAAHALNTMCAQLRLGNLAERFSGEEGDEWVVYDEGRVGALKHGREVAEVEIVGGKLVITVPRVEDLIRGEHLRDFDPLAYDIVPNREQDWLGQEGADLEVEWDVPRDLKLNRGPRMPLPRVVTHRKKRVRSAPFR